MDADELIHNIHMDGYNEGADDWYGKAWDDIADTLDEAVEDEWSLSDLLDTLYRSARKYANRVRPA